MSRCPRGRLEDQILTALGSALVAGRLDVADHLLCALEALAPGLTPGSPLAEAYLAIGELPPRAGRPASTPGQTGPEACAPAPHPRRARVTRCAPPSTAGRSQRH